MHSFSRRDSRAWIAIVLLVASLAPRAAEAAQSVRVTTNMGEFVIELLPERAPLTVANFLHYVNEGYYSGTLIHRVVGNFVIQGGGHAAADYHLKATHDPVVNESGNGLQNKRAMVGLARAGSPHSGNAQFYVNLGDNADLDPLPTRWGYAVFGRVSEGMDVVDRIGVVATGSMGPFKSEAPLKPVIIEKMDVVQTAAPPLVPTLPPPTPASPGITPSANRQNTSQAPQASPAEVPPVSPANAPPANPANTPPPESAPPPR
jgi:cyclophilin family peptidyl-prolyl cis-trans isomerase